MNQGVGNFTNYSPPTGSESVVHFTCHLRAATTGTNGCQNTVCFYSIMIASVYCTRELGLRLPRPAEPVHGSLLLGKDGRGDMTWLRARLVDQGKDILRPLIRAQVTRVTEHGMVVEGLETITRTGSSKSNAETFPQVWWVFVLTGEGLAAFDGDDPLSVMAERRHAASSSTGF